MKILLIILVGLLSSCSFKSENVMTRDTFSKTHVGMSEESLLKTYGKPLNVFHKDNGEIVYEYVERFQMGMSERYVETRRYYFHIKNNKIIHKQMVISNQPGYNFMNDLPGA
jgi:outer membrane protein assembly factor BamE (lipoprotein component of BamABCDE complex)